MRRKRKQKIPMLKGGRRLGRGMKPLPASAGETPTEKQRMQSRQKRRLTEPETATRSRPRCWQGFSGDGKPSKSLTIWVWKMRRRRIVAIVRSEIKVIKFILKLFEGEKLILSRGGVTINVVYFWRHTLFKLKAKRFWNDDQKNWNAILLPFVAIVKEQPFPRVGRKKIVKLKKKDLGLRCPLFAPLFLIW